AELEGARLDGFVRAGVAKVLRHQKPDGHFALWPAGPAYPHLTAFAIYGLREAEKAGARIDQRALDRATIAARRWAADPARKLHGGEGGTVAMTAYLLAARGQADPGLSARLFDGRRGLPRYGQAFLLRALLGAGSDRSDPRVRVLAD